VAAARSAGECALRAALDAAVTAAARTAGAAAAVAIVRSARAAARQRAAPYELGPLAAGALVQAVSDAAPPALRADAAVEAMARARDGYGAQLSAPVLAAVARAAAHDPSVASRPLRVKSVIRAVRRGRVMPTPELVRACFDSSVAGLDVTMALAVMEFARSAGFFAEGGKHAAAPPLSRAALVAARQSSAAAADRRPHLSEVAYYNGIIQITLFAGKHRAAEAALREMSTRGVDGDDGTLSLLAVLHADMGRRGAAEDVMRSLAARGVCPAPAAFAAMVRLAAASGDAAAARALFDDFERRLHRGDGGLTLAETLSVATTVATAPGVRLSRDVMAASRADVVLAMFQALRSMQAAEDAVALLAHMRRAHGVEATITVFALVFEACCRAWPQRLDLADKVREEQRRVMAESPAPLEPVPPPKGRARSVGADVDAVGGEAGEAER
jgi:hypothetical protein